MPHQSPFAIRGAIEGFYGTYFTPSDRSALLRFLGERGFNAYLYAPKADRRQRLRWWEPYTAEEMEAFAEHARVARESGIAFVAGLSLGGDVTYHARETFAALVAKLTAFVDVGVRDFCLAFDDSSCIRTNPRNRRYRHCAEAHAEIANRIRRWLDRRTPGSRLFVCPREYEGPMRMSAYMHRLGALLDARILLFYCGLETLPRRIDRAECDAFRATAGRRPVLWDNWPCADLTHRGELHLGPYAGRAADLAPSVEGIMVNLMAHPYASRLPLYTVSDYLRDPKRYDPARSWETAVAALAPGAPDVLRTFASEFCRSCLSPDHVSPLAASVARLVAAVPGTVAWSEALADLHRLLDALDGACYDLRISARFTAWRQDVLGWIEATNAYVAAARAALAVVDARGNARTEAHARLDESLAVARWSPLTTIDAALAPLLAMLERAATPIPLAA